MGRNNLHRLDPKVQPKGMAEGLDAFGCLIIIGASLALWVGIILALVWFTRRVMA